MFRVHGHLTLLEEHAANTFDDVTQDSKEQAVVAATPRIRVMKRDTSNAGLLGAEPLFERLDRMVDAATAVSLEALDDGARATANLYLQKAALAADEAREQAVRVRRASGC